MSWLGKAGKAGLGMAWFGMARQARIQTSVQRRGGREPIMDIYDRNGQRIPMTRWTELHSREEYVRVASTVIPGTTIWVSTVWHGLDHSFTPGAKPVIFETMVFADREDRHLIDWEQERYCTEIEALEGHVRIVRSLMVPDSPAGVIDAEIPLSDARPRSCDD